MKITDEYCAGVLENSGGFYIRTHHSRKWYVWFKLVTQKPKIYDRINVFLQQNHRIKMWSTPTKDRKDSVVYYITKGVILERLMKFMKTHCHRRDFIEVMAKMNKEPKRKIKRKSKK